jgi:hypothetical protein
LDEEKEKERVERERERELVAVTAIVRVGIGSKNVTDDAARAYARNFVHMVESQVTPKEPG